jgi:hypothetical protein
VLPGWEMLLVEMANYDVSAFGIGGATCGSVVKI